jgi:hypothetical protein
MRPGPRHGTRVRATKLVKGVLVSDNYWAGDPIEETRQQFVNYHVARLQHATVADGGDRARQFVMLINTMREFGELYDRGVRLRSYPKKAVA